MAMKCWLRSLGLQRCESSASGRIKCPFSLAFPPSCAMASIFDNREVTETSAIGLWPDSCFRNKRIDDRARNHNHDTWQRVIIHGWYLFSEACAYSRLQAAHKQRDCLRERLQSCIKIKTHEEEDCDGVTHLWIATDVMSRRIWLGKQRDGDRSIWSKKKKRKEKEERERKKEREAVSRKPTISIAPRKSLFYPSLFFFLEFQY